MEVRAFLRRAGDEEVTIRVYEESDPTTKVTFITPAAQISARRMKTKKRRNVWRDQAGVPLFEIDAQNSGNASLIGENISM